MCITFFFNVVLLQNRKNYYNSMTKLNNINFHWKCIISMRGVVFAIYIIYIRNYTYKQLIDPNIKDRKLLNCITNNNAVHLYVHYILKCFTPDTFRHNHFVLFYHFKISYFCSFKPDKLKVIT